MTLTNYTLIRAKKRKKSLGLSHVLLSGNHSLFNPLLPQQTAPHAIAQDPSCLCPPRDSTSPTPNHFEGTRWLTISSFDLHLPYGERDWTNGEETLPEGQRLNDQDCLQGKGKFKQQTLSVFVLTLLMAHCRLWII